MAHTDVEFTSKQALIEAVEWGAVVSCRDKLGGIPGDGIVHLRGPHPEQRCRSLKAWFAVGVLRDGRLVSVR